MRLSLDWSLPFDSALAALEELRAAPPGGALLPSGNGFWVERSTGNYCGSGHPRILLATQVVRSDAWTWRSPPMLLRRPVTKARQIESLDWLRLYYKCVCAVWGCV